METADELRRRARRIATILAKAYPEARCMLNLTSPLELLVATILAAQCTDAKVNEVTESLFRKHRRAADYASAKTAALERAVKSTGFFRQKTKSVQAACADLVEKHGGEVPHTMEELTALPGVGRKTANVVLGNAFDTPGIVVDTHFKRITGRLGLTKNTDPDKIEVDLCALIPRAKWTAFSHHVTFHGRRICVARKPRCAECPVSRLCDYYRNMSG